MATMQMKQRTFHGLRIDCLIILALLIIVECVIYYRLHDVITVTTLHFNMKFYWIQSLEKKCQQERHSIFKQDQADHPIIDRSLPLCSQIPPNLLGKLDKEEENIDLNGLLTSYAWIHEGGKYKPLECEARSKIAIIVPHRNREAHLRQFLKTIHPILRRQQAEYQIFVIQQAGTGTFNRAKLLNVGYKEALNDGDFDCFIFHDVDLLAEDDRNLYRCSNLPKRLSVAVNKWNYQLPYETFFGGVIAMSKNQFLQVNGYSNEYWGWGAEDDDMYIRIRHSCLGIEQADYDIARYRMEDHAPDKNNRMNPYRHALLVGAADRQSSDGLNNLKYHLLKKVYSPLYTNITVDIGNLPVRPNLSSFGSTMNIAFSTLLSVFTFILICCTCVKSRLVHIIFCPHLFWNTYNF